MKPCKRVAVIGGGLSGIGSIKSLKEDSIEPVCFEKTSEIGGTWLYRTDESYVSASVMSTTCINQSKEMGAVSNFPFPDNAPNYMRHDEIHKHMMELCRVFDIKKHITCNREVTAVKKADDYEESGRWTVTVKNTESGEITVDTFDAVIVAVGNFTVPNMPSYPGMSKFRGRIMHSQNLKTFESFAGERVVVVGTGCSAVDAAVEISNVAKQVYLSSRTHAWILSRVGSHGLPIDYILLRRYMTFIQHILPISWTSKLVQHLYLNTHFNHKLLGIDPKYPIFSREPVVCDQISTKLLAGTVAPRKGISEMDEEGVRFEGDVEWTKVDTIVLATGYNYSFPFLEDGIIVEEKKGKTLLYKGIFPPHLKHATLAIMAMLLPFGPGFPIGEMESRWVTYIFSGKGSLPSKETMMEEIERRFQANSKRYCPSGRMSQRVDFVPYMDDLASEIGAKPNFWKMAFTDPKLFIACIFGPCVSYQYRLVGPHKWDGARQAIMTVADRVRLPLGAAKSVCRKDMRENHIMNKVLLMLLAVWFLIVPMTDLPLESYVPFFLASHLWLVRFVAGTYLLHRFLPMSIVIWLFFSYYIPHLVIIQTLIALAVN